MEYDNELEKGIRKLQDKIATALDYCLELYQRHGDQRGWEMAENKPNLVMGWAGILLAPMREEDK